MRNVDKRPFEMFVKAYSHNGYFKSLEEIVHFYNTRDLPGAGWPAPEVAVNVNTIEMGNLGLNHEEELAIVAFLKTLSDGWTRPIAAVPAMNEWGTSMMAVLLLVSAAYYFRIRRKNNSSAN